jgi:hypothetical protein
MVAFLAGLKGFGKLIMALPEIIGAIKQLIGFLEEQFGPDWPARIEDLRAASAQWKSSQSTLERENAAKALAAAFNSTK